MLKWFKILICLLILIIKINKLNCLKMDLEINEEEEYTVLDEIVLEIDELEDVLLSCNENAEIFTKSTIKNLFRSNHFNNLDNEKQNNLVLGWQILNSQKQFPTNLTYLLIKQITFKDTGIYYCILKIPYLSFFSSILPNTFVNNLSKLWSGCQAVSEFECLASYKFKLIVRKAKKRILNPIKLSDEFKERCLIIKNGKQISQDRTLALIAMFLASLIFFLLLFYFIWMYKENLMVNRLNEKTSKKQLKKQRTSQIHENLELVKSFETVKHDEHELLRRLRSEQEKLSNKRKEDEEFFNKVKKEELDLVKRKEKVIKEEEELLRKKAEFEEDKKLKQQSNDEIQLKFEKTKQAQHLGDEYEIKDNLLNRKKLESNYLDKPINLNIKGEIKLKNLNDELIDKKLNDDDNQLINLNNLTRKLKLNRESIFKIDKPTVVKKEKEEDYYKLQDLSKIRPFNNKFSKLNKLNNKINRSPNRERFKLNLNEDRKLLLKRKLSKAINKRIKSPLLIHNKNNNNNNQNQHLNNSNLDVESTINIKRRDQSIFSSIGNFKINQNQFDKPIRLIVETPFPFNNNNINNKSKLFK